MRTSKFSEEQIIGFLREADAGLAVKELCRKHGFSEASYYGWKAKFGGLDVSEAKRLRALEDENGKLKRLLAADCPVSVRVSTSAALSGERLASALWWV